MRFAAKNGELVMATRRKRRRAMARDRQERLALRDMTMRMLRDRHGYLIQDLMDAFSLSRRQVERSLDSADEAIRLVAG
jgi:hypothetical protein